MAIIPARQAQGPERELLDAFQAVQDATEARTRALAAYDQALAAVTAQDQAEGNAP
jgi:hypothetical protein